MTNSNTPPSQFHRPAMKRIVLRSSLKESLNQSGVTRAALHQLADEHEGGKLSRRGESK